MTGFHVKALDETTWPDFARLVETHNGVWGGWCMSFHLEHGFGNRRSRRIDRRRNVEFATAGLTPPWCTTARSP